MSASGRIRCESESWINGLHEAWNYPR